MSEKLSTRFKQPGLISAPGVFDMISARIADGMGFDALYMTGYGVVASHLGLPDVPRKRIFKRRISRQAANLRLV